MHDRQEFELHDNSCNVRGWILRYYSCSWFHTEPWTECLVDSLWNKERDCFCIGANSLWGGSYIYYVKNIYYISKKIISLGDVGLSHHGKKEKMPRTRQEVVDNPIHTPLLINPRRACAGEGYCTWSVCVFVCVCVCVCVSVRKSVSTVFLDNRDRFELQTWICFQVRCLDGKIRVWSGEAQGSGWNGPAAKVSVR